MPCRIVTMGSEQPREDRLREAAHLIQTGGIVVVPTETFYGLAVDPFNPEALAMLISLKGKPDASPIPLLLANAEQAAQVAGELPEEVAQITQMFWPGPLTIVVPAKPDLPEQVTGGTGTVGIRVPGLLLTRRLAETLGRPMTGTSANLHGGPACRTAAEVVRTFTSRVSMIIDGGPTTGGASSTVVDFSRPLPRIIREGAVPASALRPFVPRLS